MQSLINVSIPFQDPIIELAGLVWLIVMNPQEWNKEELLEAKGIEVFVRLRKKSPSNVQLNYQNPR
jgi:hypothetical protein